MKKHLTKLALIAASGVSSLSTPALSGELSDYAWAEQLVHAYLYDGMLQVWQSDRRPWNRLLSVHACQSDNASDVLKTSYASNTAAFIGNMQDFGEFENDGPLSDSRKQAVADLATVAFRLFSSAYAHGYARQLRQADGLSKGVHATLCGDKSPAVEIQSIAYPDVDEWSEQTLREASQLTLHASKGVASFMLSVDEHYDTLDALVYSHAYQVMDSYQSLFFTVNSEINIGRYSSNIPVLTSNSDLPYSNEYAEFAYLTLTSGYHWGTLSVLAMLESEFPEVHEKVNLMAKSHIETVTGKQSITSETTDS